MWRRAVYWIGSSCSEKTGAFYFSIHSFIYSKDGDSRFFFHDVSISLVKTHGVTSQKGRSPITGPVWPRGFQEV
jgi:hypothetical protein